MIVRGRAEPRHRADVRVMNVFTLMTPTLCTARRSEKHPTGPPSKLRQFLCARILAHPKFRPEPKHSVTQIRDTTLRAVCTTDLRLRILTESCTSSGADAGWLVNFNYYLSFFFSVCSYDNLFALTYNKICYRLSTPSWGRASPLSRLRRGAGKDD